MSDYAYEDEHGTWIDADEEALTQKLINRYEQDASCPCGKYSEFCPNNSDCGHSKKGGRS